MPVNTSPKRRPSRTANRRSKMLPTLPGKARPGLALDTSVSRHRAPAPQQIFPYESKPQELSFISFADIKALKKQRSINKARQRQLELAQPPKFERSVSHNETAHVARQNVPPPDSRSQTSQGLPQPAMHKRIQGLRPTPLDLTTDISPSDRAITIGISVDPNAVTRHSRTPLSPVPAQLYPDVKPQRRPSEKYTGQEAVTPTIVITPAKEDFDFDLQPTSPPAYSPGRKASHRPTSSIYSRHPNGMPAEGHTPPVPPLPLFVVGKASRIRESNATIFEEEETGGLKVPKRERKKNLSVCTVFEEDQAAPTSDKRVTSQSHLPTPRRSRGWWNLITSPFSASSKSNAFFWRSPPPDEDGDRSRMLGDPQTMGDDNHAGIIFTNRGLEDLDLRSAPPIDSGRNSLILGRPSELKRSGTAPGALDPSGTDGVNIYSVPWVGAAADYFNPHKNFPSVIMSPEALEAGRGLDGWSPSQSVYRTSRGLAKDGANISEDNEDNENPFSDDAKSTEDQHATSRALDDEKSPFSDAHASNAFEGFSGTHPAATADKKFFSTPATEELRSATPQQPSRPEPTRNDTEATLGSYFSPLTATPVIEDARMGTLMGPSVVDVRSTPGRTECPQTAGVGAATMASRGADNYPPMPEKRPVVHQRNDSHGLGIDTDTESMSEKSLFPPPKSLAEQQPRLGTDRFGQLRIEDDSDRERHWTPWYRRFLWSILALAAASLILFVVLLVLFVSQSHDDMPVQAQWLNLTGFPAMPTGVATVIQPSKEVDVGGCLQPAGLWSCAPPGGESGPTDDTPNFRFEIRFRNKTREGMNATDLTLYSRGSYKRGLSGASTAHAVVRRSAWSDSLYASLPAPPSRDDMVFLGNATDVVSEPFEGEETPFYISLLNASALETQPTASHLRLRKRERGDGVYPYPSSSPDSSSNSTSAADNDDDSNLKSASTEAASGIPRLLLQPNGSPAPAQLYPLAETQPLRLFNRSEDSEHYGFYTYFDRSLYIRTSDLNTTTPSSSLLSSENTNSSGNATLRNSVEPNAPLASSNAVCVFSQSRFRVQIWTRKSTANNSSFNSSRADGAAAPAAADSTANDMTAPGSFPYPVTLTLDRHGGNAEKKGVYCYGLDSNGRVMSDVKTWVAEDRAFDGSIVNAAAVPGGPDGGLVERDDSGVSVAKGIDGGDGGCSCSWRNWDGK